MCCRATALLHIISKVCKFQKPNDVGKAVDILAQALGLVSSSSLVNNLGLKMQWPLVATVLLWELFGLAADAI